MGAVKNAYHDEICDRADAEALREGGYSEEEIAALKARAHAATKGETDDR